MLPLQGLLVIPAGLLAVSWAWSGDWLLDRPAPGRWLRLGLLLTGLFTLVVSWYAGYRAWSIRDVGPIAPPAAWIEAARPRFPPIKTRPIFIAKHDAGSLASRIRRSSSTETGKCST